MSWSGSDPAGLGIASYNVFVSINNGAYAVWLPATTLTSADYTGIVSNTYSFYSIAISSVGTVQQTAVTVQTFAVTTTYWSGTGLWKMSEL